MSITRLQQARQMYALGQRVAKTLDGSRPGYRGDDAARSSEGTSGGRADPGNAGRGDTRGDIGNDRYSGAENKASNLQTYNHNIATGQADKNPYGPVLLNDREKVLQNFYNTRPKVNIPNFGLTGMFLNLFNKGVNSPIQKFSDFGAKKNRAFFEDVIRAGKIPGLDFGTVAEMSPEQLENAYGSYMSNRMSGATDAYGNPIGNQGGEGIQTIPLQYGMSSDNSDEVEGIETIASDPFTSRYLQNQPDDIREAIESRMQNYYTV
tara:strand:+ start:269 stop:1060 length:792 start_codon:yes stop_codon:yes gene_type:complete